MARVAEITAGVQYQFSAEENAVAASVTRVFRILKSSASEYINVSQACGVNVGDQHPQEAGLYCVSYSAQYEGDSRMVAVATFNYRATASGAAGSEQEDPKQQPPDIRPSNIAISTSLTEAPAVEWKPQGGATQQVIGGGGSWQAPTNPAGDRYEGVVKLVPITTITIEQFELSDPTRHANLAGRVNDSAITIGSLSIARRALMFRGVSMQPAVEQWGGVIYRGWKASYEFLYKRNEVAITSASGSSQSDVDIGWDHAQIVEGLNIINKAYASEAAAQADNVEAGSLVLKRVEAASVGVEIENWPGNISPAENTAGRKMRGMILVSEAAKPTQRPCAAPIALNFDGTPRWSGATIPVLVYRYQIQREMNFADLNLRIN